MSKASSVLVAGRSCQETVVRNSLLKKSVWDQLERRGITCSTYLAGWNAVHLQAGKEQARVRGEVVDTRRQRRREGHEEPHG